MNNPRRLENSGLKMLVSNITEKKHATKGTVDLIYFQSFNMMCGSQSYLWLATLGLGMWRVTTSKLAQKDAVQSAACLQIFWRIVSQWSGHFPHLSVHISTYSAQLSDHMEDLLPLSWPFSTLQFDIEIKYSTYYDNINYTMPYFHIIKSNMNLRHDHLNTQLQTINLQVFEALLTAWKNPPVFPILMLQQPSVTGELWSFLSSGRSNCMAWGFSPGGSNWGFWTWRRHFYIVGGWSSPIWKICAVVNLDHIVQGSGWK